MTAPRAAPILDISALRHDPDGDAASAVVDAMHAACVESGFFVVTGHGLDPRLDELFRLAHGFFGLPMADKQRVAMVDDNGYVPPGAPRTGNKEMFDVGFDGAARWPDLTGFRDAVIAYQHDGLDVAAALLRAMAVALDLEPSFFEDRMRRPQCFLRMLRYPAVTAASAGEPPTGAHTDYGAITLLATDGVPGLQIRPKGGEWVDVVAPRGTLVVNLGDMLARWTNGRYASTPHRVVAGQPGERYSIPLFVNPDSDTIVTCLPSCVTPEHPCRYEPITAAAFLRGRIDGAIGIGDGVHG